MEHKRYVEKIWKLILSLDVKAMRPVMELDDLILHS